MAFKGDKLDEEVGKVLNRQNASLPLIRIQQGKYLIGTEVKMIKIKGESCMVRVGGGWEKLEVYLLSH